MQKNLIKVIIFDLDDTLYPERDFVKSGFRKVAEYIEKKFKIKKKEFFKTLIDVLNEEERGHIFDTALKKYDLYNKNLVDKLVEVYRFHKPNIKLYPGTKNLLNSLKKKYKLALITDGLGYVQQNKVKALTVENLFDSIIYTDNCDKEKFKPNPYTFKKALAHFNLSSREAIYIGDDPHKDFIGAKKLGIRTVRVLQGRYKDIRKEKEFEADCNINKLGEIKNLLKKNFVRTFLLFLIDLL